MERRNTGDGLIFGSERGRSDSEVSRLIDRIKTLVAEQWQLEGSPDTGQLEANRREITRLQRQLAIAVKRELSG
jgi:hypothetical protein